MIDWFLAALCLLAVCGLSLVAANRAYSLVATCRLLIAVASLVTKHMLYGTWASVIVALRLRSCGTWAYLLHSMWSLPRAGIEPVSPALTGRLSLPVPLYHQRSPVFFFFFYFWGLWSHISLMTIQIFFQRLYSLSFVVSHQSLSSIILASS